MSVLITSSGNFAPRKEFVKSHSTPHQFALLAFNGADILRLSNFPPNVIAALRALFESHGLFRGYREDGELGVSEFIMMEKVWVGKSVRTERLVTQVFSVIFNFNFRFITTIAYGRLVQDTRSLVFSRPVSVNPNHPLAPGGSISSQANSPYSTSKPLPPAMTAGPSTPSPKVATSEIARSTSNAALRPAQLKTTFAISLSQTKLRVINAPKTSTPAILNSVRSAWPRGVIDENRTEDDVYEFKLKGYGLFSSASFDRDALFHIFSLLRSLDSYSFTLITNLNLTQGISKSRTKDLWIFEAPADPTSPESEQNSIGTTSPHASRGDSNDVTQHNKHSVTSDVGLAGVGAGYGNGRTDSPPTLDEKHGGGHSRTATTPEYRDRKGSNDQGAVNRAHVRSSSSPAPEYTPLATGGNNTSRLPSALRKPVPPSAFGGAVSTSPIAKSSLGFLTGKKKKDSSSPIDTTGPHTPVTEHLPDEGMGSRAITAGPLTDSQYNFDYNPPNGAQSLEADPSSGHRHPNSDYLYNRYTGNGVGGVIYSSKEGGSPISPPDRDPANQYRGSTAPQPSHHPQASPTEDALLSSNAFRDSAMTTGSDTSRDVPIGWSGPIPEGDEDEHHVVDPVAAPPTLEPPRAGNVPSPVSPDLVQVQSVYSSKHTDGGGPNDWRKSEKGIVGRIPSTITPGVDAPALPTASPITPTTPPGYPGGPSRIESTATVFPPGAFPRTPLNDLNSNNPMEAAGAVTKSRTSTPTRGASGLPESPPGGGASSGKGWVLVNIESGSPGATPSATNGGKALGEPDVPQAHLDSQDEHDLASPPTSPNGEPFSTGSATVGSRPRRSLSKRKKVQERRKSSGSSGGNGTGGKKKFLGLFGSRRRKHSKQGSIASVERARTGSEVTPVAADTVTTSPVAQSSALPSVKET